MQDLKNTGNLESKLEEYFLLSKSLSLQPSTVAKTILPLGASLFGALSSLEAQIVYSGVQNVSANLGGASNRAYVDIDGGGNDFEFHRNHVAAQIFIQIDEIPGGGFSLNGFHAQVAGAYVYPYANAVDVVIGAAGPWGFQAGQANSLSDNGFYPNHKWEGLANGTTRFIGFRGVKNATTMYGWMRLTKNSFGNYTVVDWAYNASGGSIKTGQTTLGSSDLRVSKSVNPTTASPGNTVTYTITVTNDGPDAATGAEITDVVPAGLTFVSGSMTGPGTYVSAAPSTTGLKWQGLSIASGSFVTLTFQATVN